MFDSVFYMLAGVYQTLGVYNYWQKDGNRLQSCWDKI
jgi:hypothetical protein